MRMNNIVFAFLIQKHLFVLFLLVLEPTLKCFPFPARSMAVHERASLTYMTPFLLMILIAHLASI